MSKNSNKIMPGDNGVYDYTSGGLELTAPEVTKENPFECVVEYRQMTNGGGVDISTALNGNPVHINIRLTTNTGKSGWIMTDVEDSDTGELVYCEVDEVYARFDAYERTYKIEAMREPPVGGSHGKRKTCRIRITNVTEE